MCGRYVRRSDKQKIAAWFKAKSDTANLPMPDADYNIAPTTHQPIIRQSKETNEREIVLARWGLVPFFTKELTEIKGLSTINARAETIATSRTWRGPMKKRRCIIPASAFYEWPKEGKPPKQPYAFEISSGTLFGFAGLWDSWKDKDGHWLQSFAIVTTEANELMSRIHPRMPVILHARDMTAGLIAGRCRRHCVCVWRVPLRCGSVRSAFEIPRDHARVRNHEKSGTSSLRALARLFSSTLSRFGTEGRQDNLGTNCWRARGMRSVRGRATF